MNDITPPVKRVSKEEMRRLFNEGSYYQRALDGEFQMVTLESRHPCLSQAHQPFCTCSQIISFRDSNDDEVARAHQYLQPDKTLGGFGAPDPKRMYIRGVIYKLLGEKGTATK